MNIATYELHEDLDDEEEVFIVNDQFKEEHHCSAKSCSSNEDEDQCE